MDLNYVLIWMVLMSCAVTFVAGIRQRAWGWVGVNAALIVLVLLLLCREPGMAGLVGGACWAVFVLLPSLGYRMMAQNLMRRNHGTAGRFAAVIRLLHPFDNWWVLPELMKGYQYAKQGELARAGEILERYQELPGQLGLDTRAHLYLMRGAWEECVQWMQAQPLSAALQRNGSLQIVYRRALGETGDLHRLINLVTGSKVASRAFGPAFYYQSLLFVFAFSGRIDGVDRVLATPLLVDMPKAMHEFWRASAAMAAARMMRLHAFRRCLPRMMPPCAARWNGASPARWLSPAISYSTEECAALEQLYGEFDGEMRFQGLQTAPKPPVVTYALIFACAAMFAVELAYRGTADPHVLYSLGGL